MWTKRSGHLQPGTADFHGHRPGTWEIQEPSTDNKTTYNHRQQDGKRKAKEFIPRKPRQPGNTRTQLSHQNNSRMPNTQEKEDSDPNTYLKVMIQIFKLEREEKHKEIETFKEKTRKTLK